MRFLVDLRSHWRSWRTVAVLTGLAGGVLIAAAAGARRTDSALERHLVAYDFRDVSLQSQANRSALVQVGKGSQVAASAIDADLTFDHVRDAHGHPIQVVGPHAMMMYASTDGRDGFALDRWKLLAGRRYNPTSPNEAVLDSRAAHTFAARPGDTIRFSVADQPAQVRVVGVVAATDPINHPAGVVFLTPPFYRQHPSFYELTLNVRLTHRAADLQAFQRRAQGKLRPGTLLGA